MPVLAATFLGPLAWNAILHRAATEADGFFVDIPFKPFPVSWQDTGSGVFTLATASLFVGLALRRDTAARVISLAVTAVGTDNTTLRVTPHQLRHTYGTTLVNAGMSLQALMALMGHYAGDPVKTGTHVRLRGVAG